jgi:hypothetical protein
MLARRSGDLGLRQTIHGGVPRDPNPAMREILLRPKALVDFFISPETASISKASGVRPR